MHSFCFHHSRRKSNLYYFSVVSVSSIQTSRIFQVSTSSCHCLKFTCAGCYENGIIFNEIIIQQRVHVQLLFRSAIWNACLYLPITRLQNIFMDVCGYPTCCLWLTCQDFGAIRGCYAFTLSLQILPCPTKEWPCAFKDYKMTNNWTPNCLMIETVSFQNNSSSLWSDGYFFCRTRTDFSLVICCLLSVSTVLLKNKLAHYPWKAGHIGAACVTSQGFGCAKLKMSTYYLESAH